MSPASVQPAKRAAAVPVSGADLEDHAAAADGRHVVTDGAARAVERRAKTFLGGFDLGEVVETQPEFAELLGRDAGQRIARLR